MEQYKLSIISKTLTISKAFEKATSDPTSEEYALYMQLIKDIPDLKVCRKTHKTPSKYCNKNGEEFRCNQFKNLTIDRMDRFIDSLPNKHLYKRQYDQIKSAACLQPSPYALIRTWFVAQFPKFRTEPWIYYEKPVDVVKAADMIKAAS
jgi:hypothetical protein